MPLNNAEIQQIQAIADGEHGELLRQVIFILANAEYSCKADEENLLCLKDHFRHEYEATLLNKSAGGCMFYDNEADCKKYVNYPCRIAMRNKRCEWCGDIIPEGPILNARWIDPDDFCKCEGTEGQETNIIQFRKRA